MNDIRAVFKNNQEALIRSSNIVLDSEAFKQIKVSSIAANDTMKVLTVPSGTFIKDAIVISSSTQQANLEVGTTSGSNNIINKAAPGAIEVIDVNYNCAVSTTLWLKLGTAVSSAQLANFKMRLIFNIYQYSSQAGGLFQIDEIVNA